MSARFFKIFTAVFLAHLVLLNIVWVGFSAPYPKPPARFTYEGALPVRDSGNGGMGDLFHKEGTVPMGPDQFTLDHPEGYDSSHWTRLRDPLK